MVIVVDDKHRIKELIDILNRASDEYYQNNNEIMSNRIYDELYDELIMLENRTEIIYPNSPTQNVGAEVSSSLPKKEHEQQMLSLNKTKDVDELKDFIKDKQGILSWKLDGLTIVLTYIDGKLEEALTRGNGYVGEVVTSNAKMFRNLPKNISFSNKLVIRGEAVINYDSFEMINSSKMLKELKLVVEKYIYKQDNIKPQELKIKLESILKNDLDELFIGQNTDINSLLFKNPRNLCSGAVRQLDPKITYERNVKFYAFSLVSAANMPFEKRKDELEFLKNQGFDVVGYKVVDSESINKEVLWFSDNIRNHNTPSDGLVLEFDDINYGKSLGKTAKYPLDSIAFKWADNTATTNLIEVKWNASRTGLINPIAIFEPVELEGTTVQRASLHNLGIFESLELGVGDEIIVYKANMIIPQVDDNNTRSSNIIPPEYCPICGEKLITRENKNTRELFCPNEHCPAKINKFMEHFVSKNGMDISGFGDNILNVFIETEFIKDIVDIFNLPSRKDEIIKKFELDISPSKRSTWAKELKFGVKKLDNILNSIEDAKNTDLIKLLSALDIKDIGRSVARLLVTHFNNDIDNIINANMEELKSISGIGPILANNIRKYFDNEENIYRLKKLISILKLKKIETSRDGNQISGKVFVITGKLEKFENRKQAQDKIEELGGKFSSSISNNTDYLINNDIDGKSSKNKKAKELGVKIISEDEFIKLIEE